MNSAAILTDIGRVLLADPLITALGALVCVLLLFTLLLFRKVRLLTRGGDGTSFESSVRALHTRIGALEQHAEKTELALNNLDARVGRSVRGLATKRFDPFGATQGQQSFATALVDEHGDGIIISGIHARDNVRVYAKELKQFTSERELSTEESAALSDARAKLR